MAAGPVPMRSDSAITAERDPRPWAMAGTFPASDSPLDGPVRSDDQIHRHRHHSSGVAGEPGAIGLAEKHEITIRCPLDREPTDHREPRHDA